MIENLPKGNQRVKCIRQFLTDYRLLITEHLFSLDFMKTID